MDGFEESLKELVSQEFGDKDEDSKEEQTEETIVTDSDDEETQETDSTDETSTETSNNEEEGIEIDEESYQAGLSAGLNEDEIADLYEKSPQIFKVLINQNKKEPDKSEDKVQEQEVEIEEVNKVVLTEEQAAALEKAGLKGIVEDVNKAINQLNESKKASKLAEEEKTRKAWIERASLADKVMDDWSKEIPNFGLSKDLGNVKTTDGRVKARQEVFEVATMFFTNGKADTFESALKQAKNWYVGTHEDVVRRKVANEINEHKKRFIARPSNKKTVKKSDKSFADQRIEDIQKLHKKHKIK